MKQRFKKLLVVILSCSLVFTFSNIYTSATEITEFSENETTVDESDACESGFNESDSDGCSLDLKGIYDNETTDDAQTENFVEEIQEEATDLIEVTEDESDFEERVYSAKGDGYIANGAENTWAGANVYGSWATVKNASVYVEANGTYTRVEHLSSKNAVIVENYDNNFNMISARTISKELPLYGGFFSGAQYNFIVFGQNNLNDSDSVEVVRVVKYSKDWNRLDSCSLYGANTYIPFDAGSLSMTENGGILYILTCHEMYKSSDGLHHQANMHIKIKESDMTLIDSKTGVQNFGYGYVSHSFNQFIASDSEYVYYVDHGDAYPRAVTFTRNKWNNAINGWTPVTNAVEAYKIDGRTGMNATGVMVGGIGLASNNVLIPISSITMTGDTTRTSFTGQRNIILLVAPKTATQTSQVRQIKYTSYGNGANVNVLNPQITKINDNKFLLMWEEGDRYKGTSSSYLCLVDGQGNKLSEIVKSKVILSSVEPALQGSSVIWYGAENAYTQTRFYRIDCESVESFYGSVANCEYNGVDYSAVYDYSFYTTQYPDLKQAYGFDFDGVFMHFINHGIAEGRQGSAEFDVNFYRKKYPGLSSVFGSENAQYYMHYIQFGKAEGRQGAKKPLVMDDGKLYRFSRPDGGDWLLTCNRQEAEILNNEAWSNDGVVGAVGDGEVVYRFYNKYTNDRMYSANAKEIQDYIDAEKYGWHLEGPAFRQGNRVEVMRYYTPTGAHIWSIDSNEQKNFDAAGWKKEGIAFYL